MGHRQIEPVWRDKKCSTEWMIKKDEQMKKIWTASATLNNFYEFNLCQKVYKWLGPQ